MLGLPCSTEVNRRVAKEKLYANSVLKPQVRDMIKYQIESVVWRNKLADNTIGVAAGETVNEIQVFEVQLRQRGLDKRVLPAISNAIPYKILFILFFDGEAQAWIEVSGSFYNTDWQPLVELTLKLEGLSLDEVYENLARQISGGRLGADGDINEAVARDKQRQKLERDIMSLEKRISKEKQFNKQVELSGELRRIKKELERLAYGNNP